MAENQKARAIAILDADGVLIGRLDDPSEAEWSKARPECRFPGGFDNALHRYRLVMWRPDRWRFEPVTHAKDAAEENLAQTPEFLAPLARAVIAVTSGRPASPDDVAKLIHFLKTFDAMGK